MTQKLCPKRDGTVKVSYRSAAAARKALRRCTDGGLSIYGPCRWCSGFHLTSEAQRGKVISPPSLKTLRGLLRNAGREIRAAEKRLAKVEQKKADAEFRAAHILKQSELQTELEQRAIDAMVSRLRRV